MARLIAGRLDGLIDPALATARRLQGGASHLLYAVTDGSATVVVRMPPPGRTLATAHDVSREFRVLQALHGRDIPVPEPLLLCTDVTVIGAPFSVVGYMPGQVLRDPRQLAGWTERDADQCSTAIIGVLAALHSHDPARLGLNDLERPGSYLERQLARWARQWEASRDQEVPAIEEVARRLCRALPKEPGRALVHGDYQIGNILLAPGDWGRVAAVLDWEMSTIGAPLADLGLLLSFWDDVSGPVLPVGGPPARGRMFPDRAELTTRYHAATGTPVDDVGFYLAFAYYKVAVIKQVLRAEALSKPGRRAPLAPELSQAAVRAAADAALHAAEQSGLPGLRR
jgi:aminoglycoside phosphotransferase (APT) family kinase protein